MTINAKKVAAAAMKDIVSNITEQNGLSQTWGEMVDATRREIRKEWADIIERHIQAELTPEPIAKFTGKYRFLSNFFLAPIKVTVVVSEGFPIVTKVFTFPSVEHAYQAAKIDVGNRLDRDVIVEINGFVRESLSAGDAKRLGRRVTLRPDWEEKKLHIMEGLLIDKFTQHDHLRDLLVETGEAELREGNNWGDRYWGVDDSSGEGENHLGRLLMRVREHVKDPTYKGPQ